MSAEFCILLAEDDENDVFLLRRAFKDAGISNPLRVAQDGQAAIDYLIEATKHPEEIQTQMPCLLILDLKMPLRTGMEVLQWLRAQPVLKCLPAIILSSSANQQDIERAYCLGANAFVAKPSAMADRTDLAKHIKGFWLRFNHPPAVCTEGLDAARQMHASLELSRHLL